MNNISIEDCQDNRVGRVAVLYFGLQIGDHGEMHTWGHIMTPEFAS